MDHPYGIASRYGDDRCGSNPEELLGAAHAACFTMAFSFACEKAGWATSTVDTRAHARSTAQGPGFVVDRTLLKMNASVPGLDEAQFQNLAKSAKRDCPLSKALASVAEIAQEAGLDPAAPAASSNANASAGQTPGHVGAAWTA